MVAIQLETDIDRQSAEALKQNSGQDRYDEQVFQIGNNFTDISAN